MTKETEKNNVSLEVAQNLVDEKIVVTTENDRLKDFARRIQDEAWKLHELRKDGETDKVNSLLEANTTVSKLIKEVDVREELLNIYVERIKNDISLKEVMLELLGPDMVTKATEKMPRLEHTKIVVKKELKKNPLYLAIQNKVKTLLLKEGAGLDNGGYIALDPDSYLYGYNKKPTFKGSYWERSTEVTTLRSFPLSWILNKEEQIFIKNNPSRLVWKVEDLIKGDIKKNDKEELKKDINDMIHLAELRRGKLMCAGKFTAFI